MDEERFWELIEDAWAAESEVASRRAALVGGDGDREEVAAIVQEACDVVVEELRTVLAELPKDELLAFDRILERKLYEIDREEIHEVTDGSDDGFLYCRGFIVSAGREFYEAVDRDPSLAIVDAECETMTYVSFHLFAERFGEAAWTRSEISRESGSNASGWGE